MGEPGEEASGRRSSAQPEVKHIKNDQDETSIDNMN